MKGKNRKTKVFKWAAVLMLAAMMIAGCKQAAGNSGSEEDNKKPDTPAAVEKYTVTVTAGSNGKVTAVPALPEDKKVSKDQELTVTATADSGYEVDRWTVIPSSALRSGGRVGSGTATVKIVADTTVHVIFKQQAVTPPTPPAGDFVTITPPAAGITGKDPDPTSLPGTGEYWKGVFCARRKVTLSPYMLGKTEVPYKLWYEVRVWAESKGYTFANKGCEGKGGSAGVAPTNENKTHPVTRVSWRDCIVWCNAYTQKTNNADTQCIYRKKDDHTVVLKDATKGSECDDAYADMSKKGYRLPTEAEWEYAARFQSDKENAEQYGEVWFTKLDSASGAKDKWDTDETGKVAWYGTNSDNKTHPVGEKRKNALGLHDMSGNVWEWCFDRYDNNPAANDGAYESGGVVRDPQGAASGSYRVLRGGSWSDGARGCVVGIRIRRMSDGCDADLGLRVVSRP